MAVSSDYFSEDIVGFVSANFSLEVEQPSLSAGLGSTNPGKTVNLENSSDSRFHITTEEEIAQLAIKSVPKNTQVNTKWAVATFNTWREHHNKFSENKCPFDILEQNNSYILSHWLRIFAIEVRKVNGEQYPPKSLYYMFCAILRYMHSINPSAPNFLSKDDPIFTEFHNTLDGIFKKLRAEGVGASPKHAKPFSKEEENELWKSGAIGTHSPLALLNAIFYYNGKGCCLRGGEEHRNLKLSQFKKQKDGYIYTENKSKNRSGGLGQLNLPNKSVKIMRCSDAGERCHCYLLDTYFKRIPRDCDCFYLRPLQKPDIGKACAVWFSSVPLGRNKLAGMTKEMCKVAGIRDQKTNHSLRATGATELFLAGVPEKIIQQRTGHRSVEALRKYEHTSEQQHQAVANILGSNQETTFENQMQHVNTSIIKQNNDMPLMNFKDCQVNVTINKEVSDSSKVPACSFSAYPYNCFSGYPWPTYTPTSTPPSDCHCEDVPKNLNEEQ